MKEEKNHETRSVKKARRTYRRTYNKRQREDKKKKKKKNDEGLMINLTLTRISTTSQRGKQEDSQKLRDEDYEYTQTALSTVQSIIISRF